MNKVLESAHQATATESSLRSPGEWGAGRDPGGRGAGNSGDGEGQRHLDCEHGFAGVDVSSHQTAHFKHYKQGVWLSEARLAPQRLQTLFDPLSGSNVFSALTSQRTEQKAGLHGLTVSRVHRLLSRCWAFPPDLSSAS